MFCIRIRFLNSIAFKKCNEVPECLSIFLFQSIQGISILCIQFQHHNGIVLNHQMVNASILIHSSLGSITLKQYLIRKFVAFVMIKHSQGY